MDETKTPAIDGAREFARRRPALMLAAAGLAGFAAGRIGKKLTTNTTAGKRR